MKKLFFLLLICYGSCYAQKDTTIIKRKVVKFGNKFFIEQTSTSVSYQEFNISLIEDIDKKDDDEKTIQSEIDRKSAELVEKKSENKEFQKHLKDAIKQGYVPAISNSREQEIYQKTLKKIK